MSHLIVVQPLALQALRLEALLRRPPETDDRDEDYKIDKETVGTVIRLLSGHSIHISNEIKQSKHQARAAKNNGKSPAIWEI